MAKNGEKCKNPKNVQMRIDPYSSPVMLMIISDGQNRPKTRKNSHIWWGWVKKGEKNTKNAISQKGLAKGFWKLVTFMSYMCTLRIKSKQTSYRKVRLDMVWGKCASVTIQMAFRRMVFLIWERLLVVLMFLLKFVFQIESTLTDTAGCGKLRWRHEVNQTIPEEGLITCFLPIQYLWKQASRSSGA